MNGMQTITVQRDFQYTGINCVPIEVRPKFKSVEIQHNRKMYHFNYTNCDLIKTKAHFSFLQYTLSQKRSPTFKL